ncbi:hypothetical protein [Sphingobacterium bovistauri]|uniref:DUF4595 domain-containing protein n=1 Tax=Sphingobacterium bovistauri TaxID=2781959 RepID=A0ABS7Z328_9SPHI|nr:hypothetical protein [Sphingobacterium bovistauri]MCA5004368.1 hypothetical protein [Sphingobacterium bovistauri]
MKIPLLYFTICSVLFSSCEDKVTPNISPKLTSIEFINEGIPTYSSKMKVEYDGERIVKVSNSTYHYGADGRVIKELQRVSHETDPNYLSGTTEFDLVYEYTYDQKNRLSEVKLVTELSTVFILPSSIYRFNIKYFYQGDEISKMEYIYTFDLQAKKVVNYFHTGKKLDSVSVQNIGKRPLQDRWLVDSLFSRNVSKISYKIEQDNKPNHIKDIFRSLGFVPNDVSFANFDISSLSYAVKSYKSLDSYGVHSELNYIVGSNNLIERIENHMKIGTSVFPRNSGYITKFNYE